MGRSGTARRDERKGARRARVCFQSGAAVGAGEARTKDVHRWISVPRNRQPFCDTSLMSLASSFAPCRLRHGCAVLALSARDRPPCVRASAYTHSLACSTHTSRRPEPASRSCHAWSFSLNVFSHLLQIGITSATGLKWTPARLAVSRAD